jgi:hypothetical protein
MRPAPQSKIEILKSICGMLKGMMNVMNCSVKLERM